MSLELDHNVDRKSPRHEPQVMSPRWNKSNVRAYSNRQDNPRPKVKDENSRIYVRLNTCNERILPKCCGPARKFQIATSENVPKGGGLPTDIETNWKDWFNKEMTTKLIAFHNARFIIWPWRSNAVVMTWTRRMTELGRVEFIQFVR